MHDLHYSSTDMYDRCMNDGMCVNNGSKSINFVV